MHTIVKSKYTMLTEKVKANTRISHIISNSPRVFPQAEQANVKEYDPNKFNLNKDLNNEYWRRMVYYKELRKKFGTA